MKAEINGGEIFFETLGDGPLLLTMHGLGLDHTYLRPWLDSLSNEVTVVFYDQRGCGRSTLGCEVEELSHVLWEKDAVSLAHHLGHEKFGVFGHSYGAFLALELAARHPESVTRLVLSGCAAKLDFLPVIFEKIRETASTDEFEFYQKVLMSPGTSDAELDQIWRQVLPLYMYRRNTDLVGRLLRDTTCRHEAVNHAHKNCLPHFDVREEIRNANMPTLLLAGTADPVSPIEQAVLPVFNAMPKAEMVLFEESGHFPFAEEPERFVSTISDWLQDHS